MVKRICSIIAFLAMVLMLTAAIAQTADREMCLSAKPGNADITTIPAVSHTEVSNGHVISHGGTCYNIPAAPGASTSVDCLPEHGSVILRGDKIEVAVQGIECTTDFGPNVFTSGQTHFWISTDTMTGAYASQSFNSFSDLYMFGGWGENGKEISLCNANLSFGCFDTVSFRIFLGSRAKD